MNFRRDVFLVIAVLGLSAAIARAETVPVARIHWLGLSQISAETNAARFLGVWNLPETGKLEAQTLDKLSRAPWQRLHGGDLATNNPPSLLLRPLLDDVVSAESYLEIRNVPNSQPSTFNLQLSFAIRLPAERARLWETNLAAALEVLTGIRPVAAPGGWSLKKHHAPDLIELSRVGEWTVVGAATETNALFADLLARLKSQHSPCAKSPTNFWLDANMDLARLAAILPAPLWGEGGPRPGEVSPSSILSSPSSPRISLTLIGDGENVRTRGHLDFARPLGFKLEPWLIPTSLIHAPLDSFTAVQGLGPTLAASQIWTQLQLPAAPNQIFFWAHPDVPFESYFAAPLTGASNALRRLADRQVPPANAWLAAQGEGAFVWETNLPGLLWRDALLASPFLKSVSVNQQDFVFGGLSPVPGGDSPPPPETVRTMRTTPNLVYYQSELTGPRIEQDLFAGQLFRVVLHQAELPAAAAGTRWLKSIETELGGSTTIVTQTGARELSFNRQSTTGFTALELHFLVDWLESPQFPTGLHTLPARPAK